MRKSEFTEVLARRLGIRIGRLNSLTQRAAELRLLPVSIGTSYPQLAPSELSRMVICAIVDQGLAAVGDVVAKYGTLRCAAINSNLESTLGFTLTRPERVPPSHSSLTIFMGDAPSAVLKIASPDGIREYYFAGSGNVLPGGVERTVKIGGAALYAVAQEVNGTSPGDVDRLLEGATEMKPAASAAN
jgi:hypothetical protein